jgi:hypothetical protein
LIHLCRQTDLYKLERDYEEVGMDSADAEGAVANQIPLRGVFANNTTPRL